MGFDLYFTKENLQAGLLVSLLSVWVLVGVFYYLNRFTRRRYFSIWTVAWLFYALWLTLNLGVRTEAETSNILMVKQWCISVSATFLLWGSLRFLGQRVRQIPMSLFLCFLFVWSYIGAFHLEDTLQIQLPIFGLIGLASMFTSVCFYNYRRKRDNVAASLLSFGFCMWGVYLMAFTFTQFSQDLSSAGFFVAAVLQLFIAVSMIILVLEQVRHVRQRRHTRELELKEREKTLLQSKVRSTLDRYQRLFEYASEAIVIVDAADLHILELNHAAENLFGTDAAVASRQALTAFCQIHSTGAPTPKSAEEWFHLLCRQRPLQVMRKDGRVVPAEVEGSRIDDDGRAAYQFFFREVTERSQLEQQLQQAQKLSGLGQMISGVAHELQNAIAGIKSLLDMIVAHREVTPQTWTYLEMASHESNRVVRLVRNFLSLIREHSERRGMIDLNELIRDVIQLRKFDMAMANVEQIVELDANLSRTFADPDQMKQVVLNLVNNALQALQESSMPRRLKFRTEQQQNLLRISIEDSGPGVPEYLESKIFEPYFTTKPIGVGTGLGLSISHSIICEHQGRIFYERSEMGGAAFHIELPVLRQTREEFGQPSEENKLPAMAGKA